MKKIILIILISIDMLISGCEKQRPVAQDHIDPKVKFTTSMEYVHSFDFDIPILVTDNVAIDRAELYVNGFLYSIVTVAPHATVTSFPYTWHYNMLPNDHVALLVIVYDRAGNKGSNKAAVQLVIQ